MAALTKDRQPPATVGAVNGGGSVQTYDCIVDKFYRGALIAINAAGNAEPSRVTGAIDTVGVCLENKDNSGGSIADLTVKVLVGAKIKHAVTSATKAEIGDLAFANDDQTLVLTSTTTKSKAGWIIAIESAGVAIIQMATPGQNID